MIIKEGRTARPFQIQKMTEEKFFDFTSITMQFTMRKKDATGAPVLISTAYWFNLGKGERWQGCVTSWRVVDEIIFSAHEPWQKVCILKGRKKVAPPKAMNVPTLHPDSHTINPKKVADLQKMIPFIPP